MPGAPCAFPVHLKDVSHPGEVSRQSCSYWPCLLISHCLPKLLRFWGMFTDLPAFWECKKQVKVNTSCKFRVRRKCSAVFQQGQLDTHIYHTRSLGQDRPSTSELPPCPLGAKTTSQVGYSCLLLQFRYFLLILWSHFHSISVRESRSCSSETKLQKSTTAEKADKERTQKFHARL